MNETEFDQFADEYEASLSEVVRLSGEAPDYFAAQKVAETARIMRSEQRQPNVILDFGAGVGSSLPHFENHFPTAKIICAEVSARSLAVARKRFTNRATFTQIEGTSLSVAEGTADLLFAACVFHHIPHNEHLAWVQQLYRVAQPGARLFIFEHNPFNPLTRKTVNACEFDTNAKLIKPATLARTMRNAGWQDVRCNYTLFFPALLAKLRPLEPALRWLPLGAQYYATGVRR